MAQSTIGGPLHIQGALTAERFTAPSGSIGNDAISGNSPIDASKIEHRHRATYDQGVEIPIFTNKVILLIFNANAVVESILALCDLVPVGDKAASIDYFAIGPNYPTPASIITAPIVLDSGSVSLVPQLPALLITQFQKGDMIQVEVTTSGTTGILQGLLCQLLYREKPT